MHRSTTCWVTSCKNFDFITIRHDLRLSLLIEVNEEIGL